MKPEKKSDEAYWEEKADSVLEKLLLRIPENKIRPRLEPTARAAALLGDPQKSYRVVHVTGTNGKTSTTRFIERILREHGLRTGRFTSPHLVKLNERIAIDGEPVSDEILYTIWSDIEPILDFVDEELLAQGDTKLTFFEALAVLGFAIFADAPVDVLVLEVGMGGEWDSTNVADGDVAVFTPIDLDHTERLGKTISEIATTKAGIIKANAFVVSSSQPEEASIILKSRALETGDYFAEFGKEFSVIATTPTETGQRISVQGLVHPYGPFEAPVFGSHQSENLAVAIAAVEAFLGGGEIPINDDVLRSAISDISSPGRLQLITSVPPVLLDAAHNPAGAKVLASAIRQEFSQKPLIAVISVLAEKDARGVLVELSELFERVVVTASTSPRAIPAEELGLLAKELYGEDSVQIASTSTEALALARSWAEQNDGMVVVSGSISLVGDILKAIQEETDEE